MVREASVAALKEFMKRRSAHSDAEMVPETNQKIVTDIETSFNSTNVESGFEKSGDEIGQTKLNEITVSSRCFEIAFEKVKPSVSGSVSGCFYGICFRNKFYVLIRNRAKGRDV